VLGNLGRQQREREDVGGKRRSARDFLGKLRTSLGKRFEKSGAPETYNQTALPRGGYGYLGENQLIKFKKI